MQIHYGFDHLPPIRSAAVSVGSFDGVHRGHRILIEQLSALARESDGESVIVTFDPHPRLVLRGENRLLSTLPEKLELLAQTSIDHVIVVNFTPQFSRISSEEFTRDYLRGRLGAVSILSGHEHHFGHNRGGTIATLDGSGLQASHLDRFEQISSTAIRTAITNGDMESANRMLASPYLIITAPHEATKLLPPVGRYPVTIDGKRTTAQIDTSIFDSGKRERIEIIGNLDSF